MGKKVLTKEQEKILKQCLWDMNITAEEFLAIIEGKSKKQWPEREFCVARLLESVNWFDIIKIIEPAKLCSLWDGAKKHIRTFSIKEGMDFACRLLR